MINKILDFMEWKTESGEVDTREIVTDVTVVLVVSLILTFLVR